jgi:peptidoglycan hydrolase-like protein with peptidoglycan-binding domain
MNPSQSAAAQAELNYPGSQAKGSDGPGVKRVQEWLSLHGFGTAVDSQFGSATAQALSAFQNSESLSATGMLDQATWNRLVSPMTRALNNGTAPELPARVHQLAAQHLAAKAREVGGDNRGPWVRLYTGGHEGTEWKWCAGFVTFILKQATLELHLPMPVQGSLSCDSLAAQGANKDLLIDGAQGLENRGPRSARLSSSSCVARTPTGHIRALASVARQITSIRSKATPMTTAVRTDTK